MFMSCIVILFEVFTVFNSELPTAVKLPKALGVVSGTTPAVFITKFEDTPPIVTVTVLVPPAEAAVPVAVTVPPFTTVLTLTLPLLTLTAALSPVAKPAICDEAWEKFCPAVALFLTAKVKASGVVSTAADA